MPISIACISHQLLLLEGIEASVAGSEFHVSLVRFQGRLMLDELALVRNKPKLVKFRPLINKFLFTFLDELAASISAARSLRNAASNSICSIFLISSGSKKRMLLTLISKERLIRLPSDSLIPLQLIKDSEINL